MNFPNDLLTLKQQIEQVLKPILPASNSTMAPKDFLFSNERSEAGEKISEYYLVYLLLHDLLGYENL